MVSLPGDASYASLLTTDCRKRQSVVLCLHTPFPREYTVSRGDPNLAMPRDDIVLRTQNNIYSNPPPKKSEF